MNNFRAAGFEDAGNNLEQIKYHSVVTTHDTPVQQSGGCQGPLLKPYTTVFNKHVFIPNNVKSVFENTVLKLY